MTELVDTNVILRFLVGDDEKQHKLAIQFFKDAENGKRTLVIKPIVIAESCFVLESFYKHSRDTIASTFETFLAQKWLKIAERKTLLGLWNHYRQNMHFVDSYLLASAQDTDASLLTFDKELQKKST